MQDGACCAGSMSDLFEDTPVGVWPSGVGGFLQFVQSLGDGLTIGVLKPLLMCCLRWLGCQGNESFHGVHRLQNTTNSCQKRYVPYLPYLIKDVYIKYYY